jgi:hypothetical protein
MEERRAIHHTRLAFINEKSGLDSVSRHRRLQLKSVEFRLRGAEVHGIGPRCIPDQFRDQGFVLGENKSHSKGSAPFRSKG